MVDKLGVARKRSMLKNLCYYLMQRSENDIMEVTSRWAEAKSSGIDTVHECYYVTREPLSSEMNSGFEMLRKQRFETWSEEVSWKEHVVRKCLEDGKVVLCFNLGDKVELKGGSIDKSSIFKEAPSSNDGLKSFDDKVVASSSDWDSGFQSVSQEKSTGDPFVSSPVDLSAHMDSVFGSGKDFFYEKPANSSAAYVSNAGDWLQDDLFGNATGKSQNSDPAGNDKNEGQVVGGNGSSSMDIDWIGDDLWQTSEKKAIEKTPTDDNDDDDDWNDFASSANSKTPTNFLSRTMERSQEEIFDGLSHVKNDVKEQSEYEKQNTGTSRISEIAKGQEDDLFGAWDSFTSSTVLQTPVQPPTNHVNQSAEQNPEMNLFGESNQQRDLDSDFFSESIGCQTNSEEVKAMPSGTSTSERFLILS
ncbi:hypothetical protein N665_5633s0001 [Sinapis alba]|nr:hypothetical protein N665_5633s0001 [Sinapis alba]